MGKLSELNKGFKSTKQKDDFGDKNKWYQCYVVGCPLPATAKPEGSMGVCTYHLCEDHDHHTEITKAILEFKAIHNKLCDMVYWSPKTWTEKRAILMNWSWCPMESTELPTPYLNRLKVKLTESIKKKTNELLAGNF